MSNRKQDPELLAMSRILAILKPFDEDARTRIGRYIISRNISAVLDKGSDKDEDVIDPFDATVIDTWSQT